MDNFYGDLADPCDLAQEIEQEKFCGYYRTPEFLENEERKFNKFVKKLKNERKTEPKPLTNEMVEEWLKDVKINELNDLGKRTRNKELK